MLQIVASGLQDIERLNAPLGQPSIQFYKTVMHKRTRWASQWRRVEFDNLADFGRTAIVTLPINGELITRVTLVVQLPDIYTPQITAINAQAAAFPTRPLVGPSWAWTNGIGHAICSSATCLIGDQIADQFDSQLLEVLDEFGGPVEHFDSKNILIARDPSSFSDQQMIQRFATPSVPQTNPQTVEITFPFWWNRGPGPQALPIQALWKDKVQIRVSFRTLQQLVFTSTRLNPANPPLSAANVATSQTEGQMPNIAGCGFYYADVSGSTMIYDATSSANLTALGLVVSAQPGNPLNTTMIPANPFPGGVCDPTITGTMPTTENLHFTDAYWIVEYVSLEDREASAFRMADLEIPFLQHEPLPIVQTGGAADVRIRMDQTGLVRDLIWVAQREEAANYNAHFLFSRDLAEEDDLASGNPCDIPWWPNAILPDWDYGDGYIVPAFSTRGSDTIIHARMNIKGLTRFEHEAPSMFRALIPALGCRRCPLVDRYIYRYDFGFWPTGGLAETNTMPADEIRGCANWDKLPKRELSLTINQPECANFKWIVDDSQSVVDLSGQRFEDLDKYFTPTTQGLRVILRGAEPRNADGTPDLFGNNGNGAIVDGIVDYAALRRRAGYKSLTARLNAGGSSSIVMKDKGGYTWIAVAGGGGHGQANAGGGGVAGSAVEIAWQGGNTAQTHAYTGTSSAGTIVYSNVGTTNIITSNTVFTSPEFLMVHDGSLNAVQMSFSINTSTVAQPYVIQMIRLDPFAVPYPGSPYTLTAPRSTVFVPMKTYSIRAPTHPTAPQPYPIPVSTGDTVQFILTVTNPDGGSAPLRPFNAKVEATTALLACKMIVNIPDISGGVTYYGGGGGGRLTQAGIGLSGAGTPPARQMSTPIAFVESHTQTGSTVWPYNGGDGYYGGGSGNLCGGGGGSYVSGFIEQVDTYENPDVCDVGATIIPLKRVPVQNPSFNILSWIARYKRLRIHSGRAALIFNDVTI